MQRAHNERVGAARDVSDRVAAGAKGVDQALRQDFDLAGQVLRLDTAQEQVDIAAESEGRRRESTPVGVGVALGRGGQTGDHRTAGDREVLPDVGPEAHERAGRCVDRGESSMLLDRHDARPASEARPELGVCGISSL